MSRRELNQQAPLVLVVDDDKLSRLQIKWALQQEGYRVVEALNGEQCLILYAQLKPDIVLLDALMPVVDGFTCCARMREFAKQQQKNHYQTPILMITGLEDQASVDRAFEVGATDFLTKPIHWAIFNHRIRRLIEQSRLEQEKQVLYQQLEEANRMLLRLVSTDGLTQVANRRRFDEYLEQEWQRLAREKAPLSLVLCDIDFFKLYNDTYGHLAGDRCLQQVATAISAVVKRPADLVARYGGEEFAVILPNTPANGGIYVAEAIRAAISQLEIAHEKSLVQHYITLSLGVTSLIPSHDTNPTQLITAADSALYRAKEEGRDRVVQANLPLPT
jgi:diguanylate cyclase (GGDEF)-like protein